MQLTCFTVEALVTVEAAVDVLAVLSGDVCRPTLDLVFLRHLALVKGSFRWRHLQLGLRQKRSFLIRQRQRPVMLSRNITGQSGNYYNSKQALEKLHFGISDYTRHRSCITSPVALAQTLYLTDGALLADGSASHR